MNVGCADVALTHCLLPTKYISLPVYGATPEASNTFVLTSFATFGNLFSVRKGAPQP